MSERKLITISGVLECLENGMDRKQIAGYYDLPVASIKEIFKHPKLAGKKAKKQPDFELVDDTENNVMNVVANVKDVVEEVTVEENNYQTIDNF